MTLLELQKVLGERVRLLSDESLTPEQRKAEADVSMTISSLAKQMINNADVVLRAEKLVAEGRLSGSRIEEMIGDETSVDN